VICSFGCKKTARLFAGQSVPAFRSFQRQAERKLLILHAARDLNDLRSPPGNHLEQLSGDRKGQHSIKINDQWRICFRWTSEGPEDVEITDYH
jgi:proteic killer suppression protein